MREVTFGQYYPSGSIVHKLNASVKILVAIAYIVAVFMVKQFHFVGFLACFVFVLTATFLAKVPFGKVLKSVKAILFFVLLSSLLQVFFNKNGTPLWEGGFITDQGLMMAVFITLRIVLVVLGASLLTLTTSPVELADGIELLMYPLKWIKFPVHEFALIMSIALRFIPTLMEETDRIIKAQKARGANFETGSIFKRAKALIPVLIPLLISSFRRADELADAMDARCYAGSKNRTKYKKATFGLGDLMGLVIIAGLIVGVVFLNKIYIYPLIAGVL